MNTLIVWFGTIISFVAVQLTASGVLTAKENKYLSPPPEYIEHFHFGFSESMADSFWIRWIQDSDGCQTYLKPIEYFTPRQPLVTDRLYTPRYKNCDNSWSFKMLDAVTKLAPRFYMAYIAGGISLSVLTEDYAGSSIIFDRGVKAFPTDWTMAYRAAYHFLFDVQDQTRAAELLVSAGNNGAPEWVKLMASRLYTESGQAELGLSVLETYRAQLTEEQAIKVVDERIANIKKQMANKK